jgi:hypothetical protein
MSPANETRRISYREDYGPRRLGTVLTKIHKRHLVEAFENMLPPDPVIQSITSFISVLDTKLQNYRLNFLYKLKSIQGLDRYKLKYSMRRIISRLQSQVKLHQKDVWIKWVLKCRGGAPVEKIYGCSRLNEMILRKTFKLKWAAWRILFR